MIRRFLIFALFAAGAIAAPAPRAVSLYGTVINTTGDVEAKARITLTVDGERVKGTLATEAPLTGSGPLEGSFRNGWLELSGKLKEGLSIQFRGALNSVDYRGTYIAAVPGTPVQYGKFQLAVEKK